MKGYIAFDSAVCGECKYFHQHYIKYPSGTYGKIDYGHCVYPRRKKRRAHETCPCFIPKNDDSTSS